MKNGFANSRLDLNYLLESITVQHPVVDQECQTDAPADIRDNISKIMSPLLEISYISSKYFKYLILFLEKGLNLPSFLLTSYGDFAWVFLVVDYVPATIDNILFHLALTTAKTFLTIFLLLKRFAAEEISFVTVCFNRPEFSESLGNAGPSRTA